MCGICGIFSPGEAVDRQLLERMIAALRHRGPDGAGFLVRGGVGLGHRRLSIIDLEGGAQPMFNEEETVHLVFNGEIYNYLELREELKNCGHAFKTASDTEVIIHAYEEWDLACVERFNGMFAFALWDSKLKRLFLARDHLGIKPLYYAWVNQTLLFASEIKSLLASYRLPREVDLHSLAQLFTFRYVPSPNTLFKGIKKVPPGHLAVVDRSGCRIRRYWNWVPQIRRGCEDSLIEDYRSLVEDAVRLQMRSDVPVGLFLSSGLDSGGLLALMTRYADKPIHTFSIGFEDGDKTNEIEGARRLAREFGADHSELVIGPSEYETYYERYLWDLEEPVGNETAAAFYFVSRLAHQKVKVALTGQGADEPWAGYHRYIGVKLSQVYSRFPEFLTNGFFQKLVSCLPQNERLKRGVNSLSEPDILTRFVKIYSFYSQSMKDQLFQEWVRDELRLNGYEPRTALLNLHGDVQNLDPLTRMLYIDTRASLPDDLMMVADKTSMANSLEVRVPYLDRRLVEFVETLPPDLKLRGFQGKYLHKKALAKWLSGEVVYQKKKGFANPIQQWLRNKMLRFSQDCLLSEGSAVSRYFNQDYISRILELHREGKENFLRHIYLLVSFELWHRRFIH